MFVSSMLQYDKAMSSTLSKRDKKKLRLKSKFFLSVLKSDSTAKLQKVFTSAHLNQLKKDRKEKTLVPWQEFFSKVLKSFWSPTYPAGNQIPNWDRILNLNDKKSIDQLKWIFFSERIAKRDIFRFFQASEAGKFFPPSFKMPSIASITKNLV
ncbi:hypothetical protein DI09_581p10, partial [Mitosporidium daphniae]